MYNMGMSSHCSVCGIILPFDKLAYERMKRHTEFHVMALIQKRNTSHEKPSYIIRFD
jgi:hypothetical protein